MSMVTRRGVLALDATLQLGDKVKKLAMYEAPYNDDPEAQKAWGKHVENLWRRALGICEEFQSAEDLLCVNNHAIHG